MEPGRPDTQRQTTDNRVPAENGRGGELNSVLEALCHMTGGLPKVPRSADINSDSRCKVHGNSHNTLDESLDKGAQFRSVSFQDFATYVRHRA